jgi:hypothetical protein
MAIDNYGGGKWCNHGVKAFCCPATGAEAAIAACKMAQGKSCPSDLPQQIGTIGNYAFAYCCPAQPVWTGCQWYGNYFTCENNRCPVVSISTAPWSEIFGI